MSPGEQARLETRNLTPGMQDCDGLQGLVD